jgi:PST family polysaccharide transporter
LSNTRTFAINTTALFIIQLSSYVLPFLLVPYLTRVLGVEIYGVAAFGLSMGQICCMITDYGFTLSVTQEISKHRENQILLNRVIGAVFTCKFLLLLFVIPCVAYYAISQESYKGHQQYLLLQIIPIVGQTFQPIWFFQGIEKMKSITYYTLISRFLSLTLTLLLVKSAGDLNWLAFSNGCAHLSAAVLGIFMIYRIGYRPVWPGWNFCKTIFQQSTEFFWSRAALASFTSGGAFFLGIFSSPVQVAYYSAAEQLYRGGQSIFAPVSQALYPHMVKHKNFKLFFRVLKLSICFCIIGVFIGGFNSRLIVEFLFGKELVGSADVLTIFLVALVANVPSVLLGYPFLGALGKTKLANRSVIIAGLLQICLLYSCYAAKATSGFYVACTIACIELVVLSLRIAWSRKYYFKAINSNSLHQLL